ncbi:MAG: RNA polymerase [Nitrososphaeria archaeon]|nr:RNA polymerase [Nitrososphaeria archaeon]
MELEVISAEKASIEYKIIGEDYTLGNVLQDILLRDERVEGAGIKVPHPLKKEVIMIVSLREGDPVEVVKENIGKLKKYLEEINVGTIKAIEVAET